MNTTLAASAWWRTCAAGLTYDIVDKGSDRPRAAGRPPRPRRPLGGRGGVKTGDGAGILVQIPHRFFPGEAGRGKPASSLPDAGHYAVGMVFLPTDEDDADKAKRTVETLAAEEGLRVLGWRTVPDRVRGRGARTALRGHAGDPAQVFVASGRPRARHHGARADGLRLAQAGRARAGRGVLPIALGPDVGLQGHADFRAAAPVLSRPARPHLRVRPGPGALPLFHQHLPQLAAGPPLPLHGPQRRDQHGGRQPQLDAGPRGPPLHLAH